MTATITRTGVYEIRATDRARQEKNKLSHGYKAITIKDGRAVDLVDLRIAYSSNGTAYACIWIHSNDVCNSASGNASGCGYDKASWAAGVAISRAGIQLDESIEGRGNTSVFAAVQAIGEAVSDGAPVYTVEMYA